MRLQTRLILLIGSLLFIIIIALTFTFERMLVNTLQKNVGSTALKIAKTVALMDDIKDAFGRGESILNYSANCGKDP